MSKGDSAADGDTSPRSNSEVPQQQQQQQQQVHLMCLLRGAGTLPIFPYCRICGFSLCRFRDKGIASHSYKDFLVGDEPRTVCVFSIRNSLVVGGIVSGSCPFCRTFLLAWFVDLAVETTAVVALSVYLCEACPISSDLLVVNADHIDRPRLSSRLIHGARVVS